MGYADAVLAVTHYQFTEITGRGIFENVFQPIFLVPYSDGNVTSRTD
jgi:hypothetical protein